ncbi:unnamed protein product [Ectocarpus sp. 13 AM-2016]
MPNTPQERLDRITNHLAAGYSSPGRTTAAAMAATARPPITAHALDTSTGKPACGLPLKLEQKSGGGRGGGYWLLLGSCETNEDGRAPRLLDAGHKLSKATYRVTFDTEAYFETAGSRCFYPEVAVVFRVEEPEEHFHIPLLISPFGYSTYRGS